METSLVNRQTGEITESTSGYAPDQVALLKNTIAKDHTDDELKLFLAYCKSKNLDPFSREVYSIKRQGKITFQIGIDGLRAKAEESGEYGGSEIVWCGPEGDWIDVWLSKDPPAAAKVTIYRRGCDKGFTAVAKWDEYKPAEAFMWNKMPSNQLAKCAEALALRKAFPNKLGGLYAKEEMEQGDSSAKPTIAPPKRKSVAWDKVPEAAPRELAGSAAFHAQEPLAAPVGTEEPPPSGDQLGKDPPPDSGTNNPPPKNLGKLKVLVQGKGIPPSEMKRVMGQLFGKQSSKDLTNDQCAQLIDLIGKGQITA